MVIMNDLEWSKLSYYVIYLNIQKNHVANRGGSFIVLSIAYYVCLLNTINVKQ